MLRAIVLYSINAAEKEGTLVPPLGIRWEGITHPQVADINQEFEILCKEAGGTVSDLVDPDMGSPLNGHLCNILQHLVFKRMHAPKVLYVLGPTPGTLISVRSLDYVNDISRGRAKHGS